MLRGYTAPTDFLSRNKDPRVSSERKLEIIQTSPILAYPAAVNGTLYDDTFSLALPFVEGGNFAYDLPSFPEVLFSDYMNIGDADLYGQGIGARLLRAACRYSVERDARIREFHTNWARLGAINMAVRVFGVENVAIVRGNNRYGWESDLPLDSVFDDFPLIPDKCYLVNKIAAKISHDLAMSWRRLFIQPHQKESY